MTYFAGASAAGIIVILINSYSFYAVVATVPIILIICLHLSHLSQKHRKLPRPKRKPHVYTSKSFRNTSVSCNVPKKRVDNYSCAPNARAPKRKQPIE